MQVLLLLVLTVIINYLAARGMDRGDAHVPGVAGGDSDDDAARRRRRLLWPAIVANLSFLGFFKYYNFFADSLVDSLGFFGFQAPSLALDIILPVGISFYTFQITGYTVDVYRGLNRAEKSLPDLLLFTLYFPQLVAGPIERAGRLIPLLRNPEPITGKRFTSGAALAAWGIFKKVYIADNLSQFVDVLLVSEVSPPAFAYPLAAAVFAVQIYTDFSGYTDVARGISRMLGVELTLNFNLPFLSSNPAEFWRRWHITLGAFLRDYLYIPLGGNRRRPARQYINLMIVWGLGGLWHGASIGFLVWGAYCGLLVVLYAATANLWARIAAVHPLLDRATLYLGRAFTFMTFAHGLLLFRVESIAHLKAVVVNLIPDPAAGFVPLSVVGQLLFFMWPLILMQTIQAFRGKLEVWGDWPWPVRAIVLAMGFALFTLFGSFNADQFFYFQF